MTTLLRSVILTWGTRRPSNTRRRQSLTRPVSDGSSRRSAAIGYDEDRGTEIRRPGAAGQSRRRIEYPQPAAPHFSVRRSNQTEVRGQRSHRRILGFSEEETRRAGADAGRTLHLPDKGELPSDLRAG